MSLANTVLTYGDQSRKEDVVLNAIEYLTATENTFQSAIGKTKAIDTVHSFLVDTLATPGSLAVAMGTDFTIAAGTTPTRLTNIVEEIARPFRVAMPQDEVAHYWGGGSETDRQTTKALKEWGNGLETDLIRSTLVSGLSGTVAKMAGVIQAISKSTNTTAQTSGTVFSATILDGLMANNWTNSNGDVATELLVGGLGRRIIDNFVQKSNVVVNTPTSISNIVRTVSTFETSMGTVRVWKHRYVDIDGTDATVRVLGFRPEKLAVAYLLKPSIVDLARNGAYTAKAVYGSATLEVKNQDSQFFASGYLRAA